MANTYNRCHCYNGHLSASGQCHHKPDPGHKYCSDCLEECDVKEPISLPKTQEEALHVLMDTKMRLMDKFDKDLFSGVESERPMIGEYGEITITVDGSCLQFTDSDGDFTIFEIVCR